MVPRKPLAVLTAVVALTLAALPAQAQVIIQLDYTFDTNNFFSTAERRAALQAAAASFEARLNDSLTAIIPGGGNEWTSAFIHPGTGAIQTLSNPTIPANTIVIYAGGRDLPGAILGQGGPGGIFSGSGSQEWIDTLLARGQPGALLPNPTDFGPWGGSITFDTLTAWNFSLDGPVAGLFDFLSVAKHELGHVLGFGTADSWDTFVSGSNFVGPAAQAAFGGPVPLDAARAHWASGTMSDGVEALMTPSIAAGVRRPFTTLDFAGLSDIGWQVGTQVIPEPSVLLLCAVGLGSVSVGVLRGRSWRSRAVAD